MPSKWIISIARYAPRLASAMVSPKRRDAQHAAAVGDDLSVALRGSAVKHFHIRHRIGLIDSADRHAGLIFSRISLWTSR